MNLMLRCLDFIVAVRPSDRQTVRPSEPSGRRRQTAAPSDRQNGTVRPLNSHAASRRVASRPATRWCTMLAFVKSLISLSHSFIVSSLFFCFFSLIRHSFIHTCSLLTQIFSSHPTYSSTPSLTHCPLTRSLSLTD